MSAGTLVLAGGGTGGHVFPMLAVADELRQMAPELELLFVGSERGMEQSIVPARGYRLETLRILPLRGAGLGGALRGSVRALGAVTEARALLLRASAQTVFSVGGYAAGPVALAARWLGVPLALMEPNSVIGLANRLVAPLAQRAYTAFAEAERHFAPERVLRAGVPIRGGFQPRPYVRDTATLRVLVLGGSQGAKALNENVPLAMARVRGRVRVVHQCGAAHQDSVRARYAALGLSDIAEVAPFIDDMPGALALADLVVGRAGASAVSEICAVGRPSILVPYPFAAGDHQRKNAEALEAAGAAVCLASESATPESIAAQIERLADDASRLGNMAARARGLGRPDAAHAIAADLLDLCKRRRAAAPRVRIDSPRPQEGG